MELNKIFKKCFSKIGGDDNADVHWYKKRRPKRIFRKQFTALRESLKPIQLKQIFANHSSMERPKVLIWIKMMLKI